MTMYKSLLLAGAVIGFLPLVPALAAEPPKGELSIADNDGIFVDGRSFKIVAGHTNGDASAMVRKSGARELGPAAILFRRGNKLYLATTLPNARRDYGGSENRDYGGSENRDYGGSENRDYGGSENRDYGRGPGIAQSRQASQRPQGAYDPDYAQYRLRKFFDENWTATELK